MGIRDGLRSIFLAEKETVKPVARKESKKVPEKLERIEPKHLETIYLRDGLATSAVKRIMEMFLAADYKIKTDHQQEIDEIITKEEFDFLLLQVIKDLVVFGNCFIEAVKNKGGTKIVSLEKLDPKNIDFLRNDQGHIKYDKMGNVKGYMQKLPFGLDTSDIPEHRKMSYKGKTCIKFNPDEIIHLRLHTVGDSPQGLGLIEPLYNEFKLKFNVQEGLSEAVFRKGYPKLKVLVGDTDHPPTQEDIDWVRDNVKDLQDKDEFIAPYYFDLEYLESKHPEQLHTSLKFIVDLIISGLGIPKAFLTGLGADTNRAVLDKQTVMFERKIRMMQKIVINQFNDKVFERIAKEREIPAPVVVFEDISTDDLNSKIDRLTKAAKAGLIKPSDTIEKELLEKERIG